MSELDLLGLAAGGMRAQRTLLDVAARNVAASQASSPNHPYARLVAQVGTLPDDDADPFEDEAAQIPVRITRGGPAGDALTEMIAVLDAQRAYEADATVFDLGKRLAERTLDLERG